MEDLTFLKKTRAPHRSLTTKLCSKIDDQLINENVEIEDLEDLLEQLMAKSTILKEFDNKILPLLKEDEIESEVISSSEYDEKIISLKTKLNRRIRNSKDTFADSSIPRVRENIPELKTVKLPKLFIPKFYGETDKYLDFWNQFESSIHNNPHLSDVDKFSYLKGLVGGTAANAISGFALSEPNYSEAIKILESRFGRKDMLIQAHLNNLLNINPVKNSDDLRGLRNLYDKCEIETRSLQSLNVASNTYDSLLCPIILKLLPSDLTLSFSRKQDTEGKWEIQSLIDFLRCEIESRERAFAINKNDSRRPGNQNTVKFGNNANKTKYSYKPTMPPKNFKPNIATAAELLTTQDDNSCIFCARVDHKSELCSSLNVNEKKELLKKQGRCFVCLGKSHRIIDCVNKKPCPTCNKMHSVVLCYKRENSKLKESDQKLEESTNTVSNHIVNGKNKILLQTAVIEVMGGKSNKNIRCIFDSGAQRTYIKKEVSQFLALPHVGKEELLIHTFQSSAPTRHVCCRAEVRIKNKINGQKIKIEALEIDDITQAMLDPPNVTICDELKTRGLILADLCENSGGDRNISMLIGADYYWQLVTGKIERLTDNLVAAESKLGWLLMGQEIENNQEKQTSSANIVTSMLIHSSNIESLWKLDTIGICDPVEVKAREEREKEAIEHFRETVTVNKEGRYEIRLPWLEGKENLKTNIDTAKKRLKSTTNKLIRNRNLLEYEAVFDEWSTEGVIEEVPIEEFETPCHYLPHRGVYKENSTTKLRPVFDASCRGVDSPSLNECLEKGPNLLEKLPPILIRFRKDQIGVISDIRKAFLQISVSKIDRNFLRFLWWKDLDKQIFKTYRHRRVVFGLNCSPFLLAAVLTHHIEMNSSQFPETSDILKNSFYVDNCVTSVSDESKLHCFINESTHILKLACFDLRGWEHTTLCPEKKSEESIPVLGLLWDKDEDVLFCNIKDIDLQHLELTRRNILSFVHKIFDILGILCPTTLILKLLVQRSWKLKIGWDTLLPDDDQSEFKLWLNDVNLLPEVKIPRCLNIRDSTEISLHTFCDGSKYAYSAVVYLRTVKNNEVQLTFVQAKNRVTPLRKITIPRIELLACCIGARLASSILQSLNLGNISCFYWSDSTTALTWIKKEEHWGVFVENRAKEIRKLTQKEEWRHIPSALNPADLPSRGCSIKTLVKSKWWLGPEWLKGDESSWPATEMEINEGEILNERRKHILQAINCSDSRERWYLKYFSSYNQILRMISWILRFANNCRRPGSKQTGELTVSEIEIAEKKVCKIVQAEVFGKEFKAKNLCTFLDPDGLLRLKTKITRRDDEENFRCPIVLPSNHDLVHRLILDYHLQSSHAGVQFVLASIRQKFWILRGRKTVSRVLEKCVRCRRYNATCIETVPAPLPEDRIREALVFEVTGVDIAGPLYLKEGKKAWILLFTCAVYRAIHLELIESLSTNGFILGLRRFVARRGRPRIIYSDNGTNFVGTENLLRSINWNEIECHSATMRIQWKFNPPTASWWGGWWERLVQTVKKLLRNILGKSCLSYEEMLTVLCDAESVINSRPITYLSEDSNDLTALTPLMFLQDVHNVGVPDLDHLDTINLTKRYRFLQYLREHFRKRFRDEYLATLVQRPPKRSTGTINKNDLVFVGNDNKKRIDWPMGRVVEIYPGKDNEVRVVKIKTATGELTRPVKRVYPLELNRPNLLSNISRKDSPTECDHDTNYQTRYGRKTLKPMTYF